MYELHDNIYLALFAIFTKHFVVEILIAVSLYNYYNNKRYFNNFFFCHLSVHSYNILYIIYIQHFTTKRQSMSTIIRDQYVITKSSYTIFPFDLRK